MDNSDIITLAEAYSEATGLRLSTISQYALGDGKRLPSIAAGSDVTVRVYAKAVRWFAANWPDGLPWPSDIHRLAPGDTTG